MKKENLKVRKFLTEGEKSKIQHYQELVEGKTDFLSLIKYETIMTLVSGMPGAIGILLRSSFNLPDENTLETFPSAEGNIKKPLQGAGVKLPNRKQ